MIELTRELMAAKVNTLREVKGDCKEPCTLRSVESSATGIEKYSKQQLEIMFSKPWNLSSPTLIGSKGKLKCKMVSGDLIKKDKRLQKEVVKSMIIKAARKSFKKSGYELTSFSKILKDSDLDYKPSAISYHFKNKANLYKECFGKDYKK